MCRDENLDDVHSIKNGRFHEWYEDYKMSDRFEVGPVEAFIKVRILEETFCNNNRSTSVLKCEKHNLSKILGKLV